MIYIYTFNDHTFADNTNIFCISKNVGDICNEINMEIDKIYSWTKAYKLSLIGEKINFMLLTLKRFFDIWTTYSSMEAEYDSWMKATFWK